MSFPQTLHITAFAFDDISKYIAVVSGAERVAEPVVVEMWEQSHGMPTRLRSLVKVFVEHGMLTVGEDRVCRVRALVRPVVFTSRGQQVRVVVVV